MAEQKWRPEYVDQVKARIAAGEARSRIAADLGISEVTLRLHMVRVEGDAFRAVPKPWTPAEDQAVLAALAVHLAAGVRRVSTLVEHIVAEGVVHRTPEAIRTRVFYAMRDKIIAMQPDFRFERGPVPSRVARLQRLAEHGPRQKWTDAMGAQARDMEAKGMQRQAIADHFGVSVTTLRRNMGLQPKDAPARLHRWGPELLARAQVMEAKRMTRRAMAAALKVHIDTLNRYLGRRGFAGRALPNGWSEAEDAALVAAVVAEVKAQPNLSLAWAVKVAARRLDGRRSASSLRQRVFKALKDRVIAAIMAEVPHWAPLGSRMSDLPQEVQARSDAQRKARKVDFERQRRAVVRLTRAEEDKRRAAEVRAAGGGVVAVPREAVGAVAAEDVPPPAAFDRRGAASVLRALSGPVLMAPAAWRLLPGMTGGEMRAALLDWIAALDAGDPPAAWVRPARDRDLVAAVFGGRGVDDLAAAWRVDPAQVLRRFNVLAAPFRGGFGVRGLPVCAGAVMADVMAARVDAVARVVDQDRDQDRSGVAA